MSGFITGCKIKFDDVEFNKNVYRLFQRNLTESECCVSAKRKKINFLLLSISNAVSNNQNIQLLFIFFMFECIFKIINFPCDAASNIINITSFLIARFYILKNTLHTYFRIVFLKNILIKNMSVIYITITVTRLSLHY